MIRKERQGEQIESRIIKKVIHSYVEIGQAVNVSQLKSENAEMKNLLQHANFNGMKWNSMSQAERERMNNHLS